MQSSGQRIEISVSDQKLRLLEGNSVVAEYPVSTSRYGVGSEKDSFRTPLGQFEISEKIGSAAEPRTLFKSREPVGVWHEGDETEKDLVLSRILWLNGLEPDNANTHARYIYIHGTNQEDRIGEPASDGCIRMRNADIVELFDRVGENTPVIIA